MTDVPIRVKIESDGSGEKKVLRSLEDIRRASAKTNKELNKLGPTVAKSSKQAKSGLDTVKKAIFALGGIAIVRQLINVSDSFVVLDTSIKNVTDSTSQYLAGVRAERSPGGVAIPDHTFPRGVRVSRGHRVVVRELLRHALE